MRLTRRPRRNRTRAARRQRVMAAIVAGLALAAPLTVGATSADAATPPHYNVARGFCGSDWGHRALHRDCILDADDDTGRFAVRNHRGHVVELRTQRAIVRYLDRHATPCAEEDSRDCFWDASTSGNRVGQSFVDVDGIALYVELFG